jgi:hypothetical protein
MIHADAFTVGNAEIRNSVVENGNADGAIAQPDSQN